jgi:hypothetical protein
MRRKSATEQKKVRCFQVEQQEVRRFLELGAGLAGGQSAKDGPRGEALVLDGPVEAEQPKIRPAKACEGL